jgi:hypothetical protein
LNNRFDLNRDYYSSCDDAKEVCKKVAQVVDVISLKDIALEKVPENFIWAVVRILSDLAAECEHVIWFMKSS